MRLTKSLTLTMLILVIIATLIALLVPWQCSQAQTAGTAGSFSLSFDYSAGVDRAMQKQLGPEWIAVVKERLREAWRNHKSTATEAYKAGLSELFDDGIDPDLLLKTESNQLQKIADSVKIRKERKAALIKAAELQAVEPNIGKAYSPRQLFVESFPSEGGGGSAPLQGPGASDSDIRTAAIVIIVVVSVLFLAGYGAYALARGVR